MRPWLKTFDTKCHTCKNVQYRDVVHCFPAKRCRLLQIQRRLLGSLTTRRLLSNLFYTGRGKRYRLLVTMHHVHSIVLHSILHINFVVFFVKVIGSFLVSTFSGWYSFITIWIDKIWEQSLYTWKCTSGHHITCKYSKQMLTVLEGNSKNYFLEVILRLYILFPDQRSRGKVL